MSHHIRIKTKAGLLDMPDVEEYVCGFQNFYVKFSGQRQLTTSVRRSVILEVERKNKEGSWKRINLKKRRT